MLTIALAVAHRRSPLDLWNLLDAQWYTGIAQHGYAWSLDGKPALAFFPLYPALIHLGIVIGIPAPAAGLAIANIAALGALLYVRALLAGIWGPATARRALWLVALFPTAFFTFAPYTESLFLLAAAGALYHAHRAQNAGAGLWLAIAIMTRSTGVILIAPLLMSVLWRERRTFILTFGPAVGASAVYLGYLIWQRLSVSVVVGSEERWHRSLTFPWNGFTSSLHYLAHHATYNAGWTAENLLQWGCTVVFLGATVAALRDLPPQIVVYCFAFWLVVLCTPEWRDGYFAPFSSVDRFVLALFPLAGWAADRMTPRLLRAWCMISGALMVGAAAVHLNGGWVG